MKHASLVIAVSLLGLPLVGQQSKFISPSCKTCLKFPNSFPFAGPPMRYQQWFSPAEWKAGAKHPVRVVGLEFKTIGIGQKSLLDIEVTMANAPKFGPTGTFKDNLQSGAVIVLPRRAKKYALPPASANGWPLKFTFLTTNQFAWDGESGVILDVKLFDNGAPNSKQFKYDFEFTTLAFGQMTRLWSPGPPNQQLRARNFQPNSGITVRFTLQEGATVPFGKGCPGTGAKTPVASTDGGLPKAGNQAWTHVLTNAAANRPATLFLGGSKTKWGNLKLPLDLTFMRAGGCFLRVQPIIGLPTTAVGGMARISTPIPPTTNFVGFSAFAQWFVLDPGAPNGLLATSQGLWHVIGL